MRNLNYILLIDDDDINNYIIRRLLKNLGFRGEVVTAKNGSEALSLLQMNADDGQDFPNLILLDLNMPVMTGLEFLEALRLKNEFPLHLSKIILITNSVHPSEEDRLKKYGIEKVILKPLTIEKMKGYLEEMRFL